ncbi:tetratricopeptide repeat protein [Roseofilum sp. BLCC_M154]|uniref:Tetratricopeptide repeat protein n=1 Tax=Roseofilum acuticapitatum BLCC-M154 TaxID=3022444 RepID=A0ABT7AP82_9CYAN|nr:tetratricopeptide repeat protein [Roseofilum acuticapitatum]MDJ1168700.1 tetratricopeptide repeat protein [Roseofilum acuticapitatum BLCC-M154]
MMKRKALVIGINRYPLLRDNRNQRKDLSTPATDAEAIAQWLENHGNFDVKRFPCTINPYQVDPRPARVWRAEDLKEAIEALFNPPPGEMPDTALLFFAGHGLRKPSSEEVEVFLATSDVYPDRDRWGISLEWLRERLDHSPVRQQIVWLDCCFSGQFCNIKRPNLEIDRDRFFVTACHSFELAREDSEGKHGELSKALLHLLEEAQATGQTVTSLTLGSQLHEYTKKLGAAQQKPVSKFSGGQITLMEAKKQSNNQESSFGPPDYEKFYGRRKELEELKTDVHNNRVVVMWGESGVGKTWLTAELAKQLSTDYQVCWIDEYPEEFTIEDFLLQVNDFLKENNELGFNTTYEENKINNQSKIDRLVNFLGKTKKDFLFVFDGFQRVRQNSLNDFEFFIQRFSHKQSQSKLILVTHSVLGRNITHRQIKGFEKEEVVNYIKQHGCQVQGQCSKKNIEAVVQVTGGHPLAIDLILEWVFRDGVSMQDALDNIVQYDQEDRQELTTRLLKKIKDVLTEEEQHAFRKLSVFETPVKASAWEYLDIPKRVSQSLIRRRLLSPMDSDYFQMHQLIAQFWRKELPEDETQLLHQQAAQYYWDTAKQSPLESLDRTTYLQSYDHWLKNDDQESAAQVINNLVSRIHEKERLPSERLPGLTSWLLNLPKEVSENKPWLLLEKGRKLEKKFSPEEAELLFQQSHDIFKQQQNALGRSVALFYVGKMRALKQEPELALQALQQVLDIAEEGQDIPMQIRALGKKIGCYIDMGDKEKATEDSNNAEKLARMLNDQLGLALIVYRKGSIERHWSNYLEAERYFVESAESFKKLKDVYHQSKALSRIGICQTFQGKFLTAIENLNKAIEIKKTIQDEHGLARDYDYLADIYALQGDFTTAEKNYNKSLGIKKGCKNMNPDTYGLIKSYKNLAKIELLKRENTFNQAQEFIGECQKLINPNNSKDIERKYIGLNGSKLWVKGDLEYSQGEYEAALKSYEESASNFKSFKVLDSEARVRFSLGRTYLAMADINKANDYLQDCLNLFRQYNMAYDEILTLTYLSRCTMWTDLQQALNYNQLALESASEIDSNLIQAICFETQALLEQHTWYTWLQNFAGKNNTEVIGNENIQLLIDSVWKYYDQAISNLEKGTSNSSNSQSNQNESSKSKINRGSKNEQETTENEQKQPKKSLIIYRLEIETKKTLWQLLVKNWCNDEINLDNAYGLLKNKFIAQEIIKIELLNLQYLMQRNNQDIVSSSTLKLIAEYAVEILCPLAMRFGLNQLREETEDSAFKVWKPDEYERIQERLNENLPDPDIFLENLKIELEDELGDARVQLEEIQTRIKSVYSIYKKEQARQVSLKLDQILDIVGVRIITETEEDCYTALSVVQNMGEVIEGEGILHNPIRNFIENPKTSTGYQSIHINIRYGQMIVEFQIRTERMHLAAEFGISVLGLGKVAHRYYKDPSHYSNPSSQQNYQWAHRKRVHLSVQCESQSVQSIGNLFEEGKLELGSVDVDRVGVNQIILLLEMLGKRTKTSKYQPGDIESEIYALIEKIGKIDGVILVNSVREARIENPQISLQEKAEIIQELTNKNSGNDNYIYVITPKKDVKKILKGVDKQDQQELQPVTPVDFAYTIHEEVGNHCTGAKVNGKMVKLDTGLQNGDIVEIITNKNSHPSLDWLEFVITPTAKHRIKRWHKKEHRKQHIDNGREKLQKELGKEGLDSLLESDKMQAIVTRLNYHSVDDLLVALGYGDISTTDVINRLQDDSQTPHKDQSNVKEKEASSQKKLTIVGIEGIPYHFAGCCHPLPGEPIIGIVARRGNRDVAIHARQCPQAEKMPSEQKITNLKWETWIEVEVIDQPGVLHEILGIFKELNINIENLKSLDKKPQSGTAIIPLYFWIRDREELEYILVRLRKNPNCLNVTYRIGE